MKEMKIKDIQIIIKITLSLHVDDLNSYMQNN